MRVLILHNTESCYIPCIVEHLEAFAEYSKHAIEYAHAVMGAPLDPRIEHADALIIHYSMRLCKPGYVPEHWLQRIENFDGPKLAFIQDDYDMTNVAHETLRRLKVRTLFSAMPLEVSHEIYDGLMRDGCTIRHALTGYVPRRLKTPIHARPVDTRPYAFVYRSREKPPWYGHMGRAETELGRMVQSYCRVHNVRTDIKIGQSTRVYGYDWYPFLASGRATLAAESGSSVFDREGKIREWFVTHPDASIHQQIARLYPHEDKFVYSLPSPKMFEATMLGTALVMFPGSYAGIFTAGEHFFEVARDGSNLKDLLEFVRDVSAVESMVRRAQKAVSAYPYSSLIERVDRALDDMAEKKQRGEG